MARTGESYAVARLAVIREYQEAQRQARLDAARSEAFEGLAVELATYGQQVRAQLVYPSGLAEIQRRFAPQAAVRLVAMNTGTLQAAQAAATRLATVNTAAARLAAMNTGTLQAAQAATRRWPIWFTPSRLDDQS